jgi:hypothetical protein
LASVVPTSERDIINFRKYKFIFSWCDVRSKLHENTSFDKTLVGTHSYKTSLSFAVKCEKLADRRKSLSYEQEFIFERQLHCQGM